MIIEKVPNQKSYPSPSREIFESAQMGRTNPMCTVPSPSSPSLGKSSSLIVTLDEIDGLLASFGAGPTGFAWFFCLGSVKNFRVLDAIRDPIVWWWSGETVECERWAFCEMTGATVDCASCPSPGWTGADVAVFGTSELLTSIPRMQTSSARSFRPGDSNDEGAWEMSDWDSGR